MTEKILIKLTKYNITTPDLKKILISMKPADFHNYTTSTNPIEDLLKSFESPISQKTSKIEFTSSINSSKHKKTNNRPPKHFDILLNVIYNSSQSIHSGNIYSFYMNGSSSQVVIRPVPSILADETQNTTNWAICFWIYTMPSITSANEYNEILRIETQPNYSNLTLSMNKSEFHLTYFNRTYLIINDIPANTWKLITLVRGSDNTYSCNYLKLSIDNTSHPFVLNCSPKDATHLPSFYICCCSPSSISSPDKPTVGFRGLLSSCMFFTKSLGWTDIDHLYRSGPSCTELCEWDNNTTKPISNKSISTHCNCTKNLLNNHPVFFHPNLFDIENKPAKFFIHLPTNTINSDQVKNVYAGVHCEINNTSSFRSSSLLNAIRSLGGIKVIVTYMENLNDISTINSSTSNSLNTNQSIYHIEKELDANIQRKAIVEKRVGLIIQIIENLLINPAIASDFFKSACLDVIALIISTDGYGYTNILNRFISIANMCKTRHIFQGYQGCVEKSLIFNHNIWSQLSTKEESREWFMCINRYVRVSSSSNQKVLYCSYHAYYILKAIFFRPEYLSAMSNVEDKTKSDLISLNQIFNYQSFMGDLVPILRTILSELSECDIDKVSNLLICLLVPEPGICEVNELIDTLLNVLILEQSTGGSASLHTFCKNLKVIDHIFNICGVDYLFQLVRTSSVHFALKVVHMINCVYDIESFEYLKIAKFIYSWSDNGNEIEEKEHASQYALLYPINSIDINQELSDTLIQLAFGIPLNQKPVGNAQDTDNIWNIKEPVFSPPYINLLLYAILINKSPSTLINSLISAINSFSEISLYLRYVKDEHLMVVCHLLIMNDTADDDSVASVSDLAESWIVKYISNKMKSSRFKDALITVFCYIYCLCPTVYALRTFIHIIDSVLKSLKSKNDALLVKYNNLTLLYMFINYLPLYKSETALFHSRFFKSLSGGGLFSNSTQFTSKNEWKLMYDNLHISSLCEKHFPGIINIINEEKTNDIDSQTSIIDSPNINCTIIYASMIELMNVRIKHSPVDGPFDKNQFTNSVLEYINLIIIMPVSYALELISEIGTCFEGIIGVINEKKASKESVIFISEYIIGIIDRLYNCSTLSGAREYHLMKILLIYTGTLISFESYIEETYHKSFGSNSIGIDIYQKSPDEIVSFIKSKSWRNFIEKRIVYKIQASSKELQGTLEGLVNSLFTMFSTAAYNLCHEFLEVNYYPRLYMLNIDKKLRSLFEYRTKLLCATIHIDVDRYQNSKIEKLMLYKRIFCENGLFPSPNIRWSVSSREIGNKMRGRLMPNWIVAYERESEGEPCMDEYKKLMLSTPSQVHKIEDKNSKSLSMVNVNSKLFFIKRNLFKITDYLPAGTLEILKGSLEKSILSMEKIGKDVLAPISLLFGFTGYENKRRSIVDLNRELYHAPCEYIFTFYSAKGNLYVNKDELVFIQDFYSGVTGITENLDSIIMAQLLLNMENFFKKKVWRIDEIEVCFMRRHLQCHTALEFFFKDKTSCLLNFPNNNRGSNRDNLINAIKSARPDISDRIIPFKTQEFYFVLKELTRLWTEGKQSNFEYLTFLNLMSGRTYNDFSQYPVFPWILTDYESESIDLSDEKIYRDLSKPIGALNEKRMMMFKCRYENMKDCDKDSKPFFYGTHYSSSSSVVFYMMRLEPFASIHCSIHGGKFDSPNRIFSDIMKCWESVLDSSYDVKELIPEFFYMPEFLININNYYFGKNSNGDLVCDVVLPKWASSPYNFIRIHREALESEYVSANLHKWIDLIWGYKQTGEEAEKAYNVFHHLTYEDSVDINAIEDDLQRKTIISQIANFGQTPIKLFNGPHPPKKVFFKKESLVAVGVPYPCNELPERKNRRRGRIILGYEVSKKLPWVESLFKKATNTTFYYYHIFSKNAFNNREPDTLHDGHLIAIINEDHEMEILSINKQNNLELSNVSCLHFENLKVNFSNALRFKEHKIKYMVSDDGTLLGVYNVWNYSFAIINFARETLDTVVVSGCHEDIVTSLAFSETKTNVFTGSDDCRIISWKINFTDDDHILLVMENEYFGHADGIEHICCNLSNNVLFSSSKSSRIIAHSCSDAICMYSFFPKKKDSYGLCNIKSLYSNRKADLILHVVYDDSINEQLKSPLDTFCIDKPPRLHEITIYNINGLLIASRTFESDSDHVKLYYNAISNHILLLLDNRIHLLSDESLQDYKVIDLFSNIEYVCFSSDQKTLFLVGASGSISLCHI